MTPPFQIGTLSSSHDRQGFSCGVEPLDRYLREQATQDVRRLLSNCYVAIDRESGLIAGYYTLAAASIAVMQLPEEHTRRLPRYPRILAGLVGRLAVDVRFRGRGLGSALLGDGIQRALRSEAAMSMLVVQAKDEAAAAFYRQFGFVPLASRPDTLFFPLAGREELPKK